MIDFLRRIGGQERINESVKTLLSNVLGYGPLRNPSYSFYEAFILAAAIPKSLMIINNFPDYALLGFSDANYRYFKDVFNTDKNRILIIDKNSDLADLEDFYHERLDLYCSLIGEYPPGRTEQITFLMYDYPLSSSLFIAECKKQNLFGSTNALRTYTLSQKLSSIYDETKAQF
jgi:hypothetical protein